MDNIIGGSRISQKGRESLGGGGGGYQHTIRPIVPKIENEETLSHIFVGSLDPV